MKVLITTDLEGVSGIVDWDNHVKGTPMDMYQRELMTGEVNAAIEGAFEAGAEAVKVAEGHDALDFRYLDERATLVPARYPATPALQGWEGHDALLLIGHHSMAGTPDGVLAHSYNRATRLMLLNGMPIGEIGMEIAEAGDYGFPAVMVSGDLAACREAAALVPGIETAPVKTGYGENHAECLHPKKARALIREKVLVALGRLSEFKPYVVPGPVRIEAHSHEPFGGEVYKHYTGKPGISFPDTRTYVIEGYNVVEAMARRCALDFRWPGREKAGKA